MQDISQVLVDDLKNFLIKQLATLIWRDRNDVRIIMLCLSLLEFPRSFKMSELVADRVETRSSRAGGAVALCSACGASKSCFNLA